MRLFIAIPLSDAMKDALTAVQDEMYDNGVRGNFTSRENMHLTLAFIGEYPDKDQVMDALSTVSFSAFSLSLSGMGCFRDLWWAGMDESAPLHAVVRRIRHALAENNIPFDRKRFSRIIQSSEVVIGFFLSPRFSLGNSIHHLIYLLRHCGSVSIFLQL